MKLRKTVFVISGLGFILLYANWLKISFNTKSLFGFVISNSASYVHIRLPNVKYVLIWNCFKSHPLSSMSNEFETFIKKKCPIRNCYVTNNKNFLGNITNFHVILFHGPEIIFQIPHHVLPRQRSSNQSYIFASMESADNYYVPDIRYNGVFNFTWTYKLDSDIYFGYIIIKDHNNKVIGPKANMTWLSVDDMLPINETIKEKLRHKKLAAAWFVSNCESLNNRQKTALKIQGELDKYNWTVDIFGECMDRQCPKNETIKCFQMLQRDYYFYFAFENSMSDDYVTEKLLNALHNYAVPVVLGGADYKRFMPDGIYLDARNTSVKKLVKKMIELMTDENKYHNYFKWHNHYSYHRPEDSSDTDSYCEFCKYINQIELGERAIADFFQWWNPHAKTTNQLTT